MSMGAELLPGLDGGRCYAPYTNEEAFVTYPKKPDVYQ